MREDKLEYFGERLIVSVRDRTIANFDKIIDGKMKGVSAQKIREELECFSDKEIEVLKWVIPQIVDMSMHNFLVMIEDDPNIEIEVTEGDFKEDIRRLSDGLAGELYTEDGWIAKYSKERHGEK